MLFVPDKRPSPKTFRFTEADQARLARLAERLNGSEAQAVRFGLAALEGVLDHGLAEWTFEGPDGKRQILLRQPVGLALGLVENDEGGFTPWQMA